VDRQLENKIHSQRLRQFLLKNVYRRDNKILDWRLNLHVINANLLNIFEGVDVPGRYTGPALFIRGGRSDYIREEDIEELKSNFPGIGEDHSGGRTLGSRRRTRGIPRSSQGFPGSIAVHFNA